MTLRAFLLRLCVVLLFAMPLKAFADTPTAPDQVLGLPVKSVSFESPLNLSYDDLITSVHVRAGEMLDSNSVSRSIEDLRLRRVFQSVAVRYDIEPGAVNVVFVLTPVQFVREVRFRGNSTLSDDFLRRKITVPLGAPLNNQILEQARTQLARLYAQEGFYQSQASTKIEPSIEPQVRLVLRIEEGYRSRISSLRLDGAIPPELEKIIESTRDSFLEREASTETLKALVQALLLAARREGFLQASIKLRDTIYSPIGGDVSVVLSVNFRRPVTIFFEGNSVFTPEELLAPLRMETRTVPFSPNAIASLCRDIELLYQQEGYLFAEAKSERLPLDEAGRELIRVSITEGRQVRVGSITFNGNTVFSSGELSQMIVTSTAAVWPFRRWLPGVLLESTLAGDLAKIEDHYADHGYLDARASFELQLEPNSPKLGLAINIKEGLRRFIENVEVVWQGFGAPSNPELIRNPLSYQPSIARGDPLSRSAIDAQSARLQEYLLERGFPNARVSVQADREAGNVRFTVDAGQQVTISRVVLQGNAFTHDSVIRRELSVAPGQLWKQQEVVKSEAALFQLGHFRSASLQPVDGVLDEPQEELAVKVIERDTGLVGFGADVNSEDGLHLNAELGQRNLNGTGDSLLLGFDGFFKTGNRVIDAGRSKIVYGHPHVLGSDSNLVVEGFGQFDVELIDEFSYDRLGASTFLRQTLFDEILDKHLTSSLGWLAYQEDLFDVLPDVVIGENDTGNSLYSFIRGDLVYDDRDDSFNPRKGFRSALSAQIAGGATGSEINMLGLSAQHSIFTSLNKRLLWTNTFRFSATKPYSDTEVVPISQRLFLGGRSSLRGYSLHSLGPRGEEGNIVGGDRSWIVNSEFQLDVTENIAGVVFLDLGAVYLKEEGTFEGDSLNYDDIRYSPGFGIRYKTPIGPLSADYGFALDREFGESIGQLNFGIGGAF